jgi:hypothetical protein
MLLQFAIIQTLFGCNFDILSNSFPSSINTHIIIEVFQSWGLVSYFNLILFSLPGSRDGSVGISPGYGLDSRSSILSRGKRFFSSPQRPYWL